MRLKDVVELIRVDMPDFTEGPFDVEIQSDDGGTHIVISVEKHKDSSLILENFSKRFTDKRIIVLNVPDGMIGSK